MGPWIRRNRHIHRLRALASCRRCIFLNFQRASRLVLKFKGHQLFVDARPLNLFHAGAGHGSGALWVCFSQPNLAVPRKVLTDRQRTQPHSRGNNNGNIPHGRCQVFSAKYRRRIEIPSILVSLGKEVRMEGHLAMGAKEAAARLKLGIWATRDAQAQASTPNCERVCGDRPRTALCSRLDEYIQEPVIGRFGMISLVENQRRIPSREKPRYPRITVCKTPNDKSCAVVGG